MDGRYWPFPIVKPEAEWDEFDRDYVAFMRTAYDEGFQPYSENASYVAVGNWSEGRSASLIFRGRQNGWEALVSESECCFRLGPHYGLPEHACVCVRPPFRAAGYLALEWMRDRALASLLADFDFVGGSPAGIVLRGRDLVA